MEKKSRIDNYNQNPNVMHKLIDHTQNLILLSLKSIVKVLLASLV